VFDLGPTLETLDQVGAVLSPAPYPWLGR